MDDIVSLVDWSRAQFALTAIYHWLFVPLTLGLSVIVAVMETMYVRTGDVKWLGLTKFWMRLFCINFAMGVATGIILEFEFGTNWSNYSWFVGDIFGAPLAIEGLLAFFMESTFIAVMFFGWKKVSKRFHLTATWLTAIGSSLSAWWILVANSWMQYPVGMEFDPAQMRNVMADFWAVAFSPVAVNKFFHAVLCGWTVSGVFVIGVSCWMLMKKRNIEASLSSIKLAGWVGLIGIVGTMATGDGSAKEVARVQPMKLAAMEGVYHGNEGQEITAFGVLTPGKTYADDKDEFIFHIAIPKGLSFLATGDFDAFVPGVNDLVDGYAVNEAGDTIYSGVSYAERIARGKEAHASLRAFDAAMKAGDTAAMQQSKAELMKNYEFFGYGYFDSVDEAIPNVPITFYMFHLMVILGGYLLAMLAASLFLAYKKQSWLLGNKLVHLVGMVSIPLVWLCSEAGWAVAECGRQPWLIEGLMPAKAAISAIPATSVIITFVLFAVLFTALLAAELSIMMRQISKHSKEDILSPEV